MNGLPETILNYNRWNWFFWLLAIAFLLRCPVFVHPFFNGDEATYSVIANSILHGNLLYSSVVDHKPPMIYLTYSLILSLSPRFCIGAVQFISILCIVLTALMLERICRSAGRPLLEERLAGLSYVAFSAMGPGKDMLAANAEIFMMLPTVTAAWLFVRKRNSTSLAAAGFLCSIAFLYKYQGGAILGTLVFTLLAERNQHLLARFSHLLFLGVGFLLPLITTWLVYLLKSQLDSLYFWGWSFPLVYAGLLPFSQIAYNGLVMTLQWGLPNSVLLFAAYSGVLSLKRDREVDTYYALLVFWLLWSILAIVSGGRFTLHYYIQLLPVLSLLAAVGFGQDAGLLHYVHLQKEKRDRISAGVIVMLVLLPLCLFWTANILDHRLRPRIAHNTKVYKDVGNWFKENSNRQDTIFVWGNSPEIYYFSERSMGTRFVFCNYHSGKIWGTLYDQEGAENTGKMVIRPAWEMLLSDIRERKPNWIVDAAAGGLDRWRGHEIRHYGQLWELVSFHYSVAAEVDGTTIYKLLSQ